MSAACSGQLECLKFLVMAGGDYRQQRDTVRNYFPSCVLHSYCTLHTKKVIFIYYFSVELKCFMLKLMMEKNVWYVEFNYLFILCEIILIYVLKMFVLRIFWFRVLIVCLVFYQYGNMNAMDWAKSEGRTACYEFLRDFDQVGKHRSEFLHTNLSFFYYLLFFNFISILFNSKLLYLILCVDIICL